MMGSEKERRRSARLAEAHISFLLPPSRPPPIPESSKQLEYKRKEALTLSVLVLGTQSIHLFLLLPPLVLELLAFSLELRLLLEVLGPGRGISGGFVSEGCSGLFGVELSLVLGSGGRKEEGSKSREGEVSREQVEGRGRRRGTGRLGDSLCDLLLEYSGREEEEE